MRLTEIVGQPRAVALLQRAFAGGRVAHAYAFVGPAGSGRMTTALAFAEALLCRDATGDDGGCGRCRDCRLVGSRQHPDLHVIAPSPPERNPKGPRAIRIGDIRELERWAALRPVLATRKVFLVAEADRMTDDTPHAFLKTLEEPPAHTVMVLVLGTVRAVPATVLSRCQLVRFVARPDESTAASRAEALSLVDEVRTKGYETLSRRLSSVDRERAERLIDAYWLLCRDLLVAGSGGPASLLINTAQAETVAREADRWSMEDLLREIQACRDARAALVTNVSPRLTVEVLLSRLALRAA